MDRYPTPYYAVIFTSILNDEVSGYEAMSVQMEDLAQKQPGFLGMETVRQERGITVSYWESLEAIKAWKEQLEHQKAQTLGKSKWYKAYTVRVAKVERDYIL